MNQTARTTPPTAPQDAQRAALDYAEHGGWPVLPGSVWNGRRYVIAATNRPTNGVQPALPRNYATTSPNIINTWWTGDTRLKPTVLLRSGTAFDVFSVARPIADIVLRSSAFKRELGPVVYRPDQGRAYFLVTLGELPPGGFGVGPDQFSLLPCGSWILVPPARAAIGCNVSWWVSPEAAEWQLPAFASVRDLLMAATETTMIPATI